MFQKKDDCQYAHPELTSSDWPSLSHSRFVVSQHRRRTKRFIKGTGTGIFQWFGINNPTSDNDKYQQRVTDLQQSNLELDSNLSQLNQLFEETKRILKRWKRKDWTSGRTPWRVEAEVRYTVELYRCWDFWFEKIVELYSFWF